MEKDTLKILVSGFENQKTRAILAKDLVAYKSYASKKNINLCVVYDASPAGELAKSLSPMLGLQVEPVLGAALGEEISVECSFVLFYERATNKETQLNTILSGLTVPIVYRDTAQPETYDHEFKEDRLGSTSYAKYRQAYDLQDTKINLPNLGVKILQQIDLRPPGWGIFPGDDSGRTFKG